MRYGVDGLWRIDLCCRVHRFSVYLSLSLFIALSHVTEPTFLNLPGLHLNMTYNSY